MEPTVFNERHYGLINWLGFWTLYLKEVRRFLNVYTQTILAPMATTLLYLAVFLLALGGKDRVFDGMSYGSFLAPGLIMMAMTQNAFANTSSSLVIAKVQGNIVDLLMPPLSAFEVTIALAFGGATRGLVVGCAVGLAMVPFVPLTPTHLWAIGFYGFFATLFLSTIGVLGGIWSEKFDHIAAVTNFIVVPLSFLSGTFYTVDALPGPWGVIVHLDPFFYAIDGFRYGFTGQHDASLAVGMTVLVLLDAALLALCWRLFAVGYKLKA